MEVYALAEVGANLIPEAWKGLQEVSRQAKGGTQRGGEVAGSATKESWDREGHPVEQNVGQPLLTKPHGRLSDVLHMWPDWSFPAGVSPHGVSLDHSTKGLQVMSVGPDSFTRLVVQVHLKGRTVDALVDIGCGRTLMQQS